MGDPRCLPPGEYKVAARNWDTPSTYSVLTSTSFDYVRRHWRSFAIIVIFKADHTENDDVVLSAAKSNLRLYCGDCWTKAQPALPSPWFASASSSQLNESGDGPVTRSEGGVR